MSVKNLSKELEIRKLKLAVTKANMAKEEYEYKIMEKLVDIERLKEQQELQDGVIKKSEDALNKLLPSLPTQ